MRKLFVTFVLLCFAVSLSAQHLFVMEINGTAEISKKGKWMSLVKAQALYDDDIIRTSKHGYITILDNEREKVYSIQNETGAQVQSLIASQKFSVKHFAREVVEVISNILFQPKDKSTDNYQTTGGVTYRSDNADEIIAAWLKNNLDNNFEIKNSSYDFTLQAVDTYQNLPIKEIKAGEYANLLVSNNNDIPLYVNVIDIDGNLEWTAVIPKDEVEMMSSLLIPPHASVILPYPIQFFEPVGTDQLILLAYPMPFNVQRIINLYRSGNVDTTISAKVGGTIMSISIK